MPETKTKNKSKIDLGFELPLDTGNKSVSKIQGQKSNKSPDSIKLKTRDPSEINLDFSRLTPNQIAKMQRFSSEIPNKLKQMGIEPENDIEEPIVRHGIEDRIRPKIENLPVVISKELTLHGSKINPKFTMVKDLPGYMQGGIRAFGREVMKVFAPGTPLEKIRVIATIGGLNSKEELAAVANYLKNYGIKNENLSGKIVDMLPGGYSPEIRVYDAAGYRWLVVKDFAGTYIYVGENPNPPHIKNDQTSKKTIAQEMHILKSKLEKLF